MEEHLKKGSSLKSPKKASDEAVKLRKRSEQMHGKPYPTDVSDAAWWFTLIGVVIVSLATRLYNIAKPDHVCWDETHFGKMGSYYINRTFFFDVHPPLGKMLVGLSGLATGYSGNFSFDKPGDKYGETPYIGMRVFCALLGSSLPPLCYGITWELSASINAAILAAAIVILDVGMVTLTQYILLDPPLLFFITAATFCYLKFSHTQHSVCWWVWMLATGGFLACAVSVKFVGLFVILLVGFSTVADLWNLLGDLSMSMHLVMRHFVSRAVGLIVWPALIYTTFFYIHLRLLNNSGSGDGFMSSAFQAQLIGNPLYNASMPEVSEYISNPSVED